MISNESKESSNPSDNEVGEVRSRGRGRPRLDEKEREARARSRRIRRYEENGEKAKKIQRDRYHSMSPDAKLLRANRARIRRMVKMKELWEVERAGEPYPTHKFNLGIIRVGLDDGIEDPVQYFTMPRKPTEEEWEFLNSWYKRE